MDDNDRPYLPHGEVVQTVGAVEDHTLHGQSLGQILGGLGFPGAGWTLGSAAQTQVKSPDLRNNADLARAY